MPKIKVPVEVARELIWDEGGLVEAKVTGTSRWSIHYKAIVLYQGKHYQTYYSVGATESQEERPWEYEDEAELVEVESVPKTIMTWEIKKDV